MEALNKALAVCIMSLQLRFLVITLILSLPASGVFAQSTERRISLAVLDFADSSIGRLASDSLSANLRPLSDLRILDRDQARTAARGAGYSASLNMPLAEARNLGAAIGSDFYILGDAQTIRRSPSTDPIYFEAYSSVFLVSSRTGRLVTWQRQSFQASTPEAAEKQLLAELSRGETRSRILIAIRRAQENERMGREFAVEKGIPVIETAPENDRTSEAKGLRLPRPYRRLQPSYPDSAATAEVEAVVDVLVDLDSNGEVGNVEVARWAGFGLDEATIATVRQLHFFPAMRNGTAIPLRVLLRYNFRKPPK
jgi:TonB family protein